MVQRIKKARLAEQLAFQAGVEQADENMWLLDAVLPVLQIPSVPPPASAGRLPFYMGRAQAAVAAELSQVGIRCISAEFILHVTRVDIINTAGADSNFQLRREDGLGGAVTATTSLVPLYIDAGPNIVAADKVIVADAAVAARGVNLIPGNSFPVAAASIERFELDCYIQGGTLWVSDTTVNLAVTAAFRGFIIPVIQAQAAG